MEDSLVPLGQLQPAGSNNKLVVSEKKKSSHELAPQYMGVKGMVPRLVGGTVLHVKKREVEIGGEKYNADPHDIIAMIRSVTQQIGEYKKQDNLLSRYLIDALRKARSSMVSDLQKFGIHWEIDKTNGESTFWM